MVIRTRKKTYGLPEAMNLVRGRFQASAAGFGFVVPDSGREDYYVSPEDTMEAWNGDTVLVRPEGHGSRGSNSGRRGSRFDGNPQASVVRIVERNYAQLVGTLEFSHGYPILKPDDFRARHRILLLAEEMEGLSAGAAWSWTSTGPKTPAKTKCSVKSAGCWARKTIPKPKPKR
ncbi:hypothetical protein [Deinococcus radiophilus]|uniref:hypothetical protein n=1 Tax=Deinococcus radiophilus TaxID=32062 RepID=UPI00360DF62A